MTKLNEGKVLDIRAEYQAGETTTRKIAEKYHVTDACIYAVIKRVTWRHI